MDNGRRTTWARPPLKGARASRPWTAKPPVFYGLRRPVAAFDGATCRAAPHAADITNPSPITPPSPITNPPTNQTLNTIQKPTRVPRSHQTRPAAYARLSRLSTAALALLVGLAALSPHATAQQNIYTGTTVHAVVGGTYYDTRSTANAHVIWANGADGLIICDNNTIVKGANYGRTVYTYNGGRIQLGSDTTVRMLGGGEAIDAQNRGLIEATANLRVTTLSGSPMIYAVTGGTINLGRDAVLHATRNVGLLSVRKKIRW